MEIMGRKIHVIVHEPLEEAANIHVWSEKNNIVVEYIRIYDGDKLPSIEGIAMVAVMGGNMHVHDVDEYPWLVTEKEWLADIIRNRLPLIGICLGAQLITDVLGGTVVKNKHKEVGFIEIEKLKDVAEDSIFSVLPESFRMFEWHEDRCVLPESVRLLAKSEGCECQAFEYNGHVLGVQFHPEYSINSVKNNLNKSPNALVNGGEFVQSEEEIFDNAHLFETTTEYLCRLLDRLFLVRA